jgi:Flp pilus assembly pilin Flp
MESNLKPIAKKNLLEDERGANVVEYIILVGVVALIAFAGFKIFGDKVSAKIESQSNAVEGINDKAGGQ